MIEKEGTKFIGEYSTYAGDTAYKGPDGAWLTGKMVDEFKTALGCTSTCVLTVEKSKTADITTQRRRKLSHANDNDADIEQFTRFTVEVTIFEDDPEYDALVFMIDKAMTMFSKHCSDPSSADACLDFIYIDPDASRGGFFFNMVKDVVIYVYVAPPPPPMSGASQMSSLLAAVVAPALALLFVSRS